MRTLSQNRISLSEDDTKEQAKTILHELEQLCTPDQKAGVILLQGDLGAGKTIFTKGIAHAMGVEDTVTSPTFILQSEYLGKKGYFKKLYHFDLYRLDESQEIEYLNIPSLLQPRTLIVIEWSEKSPKLFEQLSQKAHVRTVQLEHRSPTERHIKTV